MVYIALSYFDRKLMEYDLYWCAANCRPLHNKNQPQLADEFQWKLRVKHHPSENSKRNEGI